MNGVVINVLIASMEPGAWDGEAFQEAVHANAIDMQIKIIMNMTVAQTILTEIFKIVFDYLSQLNKIVFSKCVYV